MTTLRLFAWPLAGALIGWSANRLALFLLFRPRRPRKFLGLTFQGLIPSRREDILRGLADGLSRALADGRILSSLLARVDWEAAVGRLLDTTVDEQWACSPWARMPLIGALGGTFIGQLKPRLTREIVNRMACHREEMVRGIIDHFDLKMILLDPDGAAEIDRLESGLETAARREFRPIEIMGGALGFIVGALALILEAYR